MDGLQPTTTDKMREIRESEGGLGVVTTDQLRGLREDATSSPKLIATSMATEEAITLLIRVAIVDERRAKLLAIQSAMQSEEQWCRNAMLGVIMASLETFVVEAGDNDTITQKLRYCICGQNGFPGTDIDLADFKIVWRIVWRIF